MEGAGLNDKKNEKDNVGTESCSCVFGNPCVDPYGCKDWYKVKCKYLLVKEIYCNGFGFFLLKGIIAKQLLRKTAGKKVEDYEKVRA